MARSLNDEFNQIDSTKLDEDELIDTVAKITASKCSFVNDYEIVQVCVDRYLGRGAGFLAKLLRALEENGQELELDRLFTQTVFPIDWDFESFSAMWSMDVRWAFMCFAGVVNTPFNLAHFVQNFLFNSPQIVDAIFRENWNDFSLIP